MSIEGYSAWFGVKRFGLVWLGHRYPVLGPLRMDGLMDAQMDNGASRP
jgi:hypothetical protein